MSRPFSPRSHSSSASFVRVNGKIRSREVRVIGADGQQLGVLPLGEALTLARNHGVDLVEIAPNANPPVCRVVDYGKYRYEQSKKEKESRKHQHANKVKEIQLSPTIDPHDFGVKLHHAVDFLCEEMKVKVTLRFRGREMAHKEFGFQQVEKFLKELAPFGHPDSPAKLVGRGINVMISPLPRNKRAKNPYEGGPPPAPLTSPASPNGAPPPSTASPAAKHTGTVPTDAAEQSSNFGQNPFANLDLKVDEPS